MAAVYGVVYLRAVQDTPEGVAYVRSRKAAGLEVTNRTAVFGLAALTVPVCGHPRRDRLAGLGREGHLHRRARGRGRGVIALLAWQLATVFRVNGRALRDDYPAGGHLSRCARWRCSRLRLLLHLRLRARRGVDAARRSSATPGAWRPVPPALAASSFAFMNLVTRPGGGLLSDVLGSRKRTLTALLAGLAVGYVGLALPRLGLAAARGHRRVVVLLGVRPGRQRRHLRGRPAGEEAGERADRRAGRRLRQRRRHRVPHVTPVRVAPVVFSHGQSRRSLATVVSRWLVEPASSRQRSAGPPGRRSRRPASAPAVSPERRAGIDRDHVGSPTDEHIPTPIDDFLRRQQQLTAVERFAAVGPAGRPPRRIGPLVARPPARDRPRARASSTGSRSTSTRAPGARRAWPRATASTGSTRTSPGASVGLLHRRRRRTAPVRVQQTVTTACHHCVEPACLDGLPGRRLREGPDHRDRPPPRRPVHRLPATAR